jgi:hypothetical protein
MAGKQDSLLLREAYVLQTFENEVTQDRLFGGTYTDAAVLKVVDRGAPVHPYSGATWVKSIATSGILTEIFLLSPPG